MAIRVTKPITKNGRVYRQGEIIDNPTSVEQSMCRLYKWEIIRDSASQPPLGKLGKPQLVQLARERGLDVVGLTKAEIVELLEDPLAVLTQLGDD